MSRWLTQRASPLAALRALDIRSVFDIGAHAGEFAASALEYFPRAAIYCFEPLPDAYAALERKARRSGGRILPFRTALGEAAGTTALFRHRADRRATSLLQTSAEGRRRLRAYEGESSVRVPIETLDDLVDRLGPEQELLVKINVLGAEDRVIRGGRRALARASACYVTCVVAEHYEDQAKFEDVVAELAALGLFYRGNADQLLDASGFARAVRAVFVRPPW